MLYVQQSAGTVACPSQLDAKTSSAEYAQTSIPQIADAFDHLMCALCAHRAIRYQKTGSGQAQRYALERYADALRKFKGLLNRKETCDK